MEPQPYDALLVLSFGGPEGPEDVVPFLENVLRGRNVPHERMLEVAENYLRFGGRSPINQQNRNLIAALRQELDGAGIPLPIYWGNRNWHPLLPDTMKQMIRDGVRRTLVFVTSAYSSYSACRQYRDDLARAQREAGPAAPSYSKIRQFYNHPGFIQPLTDNLRAALAQEPGAPVLFTAHSIPLAMAATSRYVSQLEEVAELVAQGAGAANYRLVYQSRSGPPSQPWLEPDVRDAISEIAATGAPAIIVAPIGFISDHMEVLFDLDHQAREHAESLGLRMFRAATVGADRRFISMIRQLVEERLQGLGGDECPSDCCPNPQARPLAEGRI